MGDGLFDTLCNSFPAVGLLLCMANRRMFSLDIVDSDAFLDMPESSQNLYFHLGMRADDDGFVSSPKKILRVLNSREDDLKLLVAKRFILSFPSGICVIKHWKMNNYIQADRYKPTVYKDEFKSLKVKENGSYTELNPLCIQDVSKVETQVRLGKDSNISDSKESVSIPLVNKKEDMAWKRAKDENEHYEEPAIDMDSRKDIEDEATKVDEERKELNTKIRKNLRLFEEVRGLTFGVGKDLNFHVKIYRELLENGWTHQNIAQTFIDLNGLPLWKEKKEKGEYPGMNTVQFHLRNKKPS